MAGSFSGGSRMDVHVVTPDREVWAGEATFVVARAAGGEIGILPGHEPVLSVLASGSFKIESPSGDFTGEVDGGFLSVGRSGDTTRVDVLAEHVNNVSA